MVRGGSAQHVLVVGVEKLSDFTDPYDRGSAFIFGDGAGAAIVGPSDTPAIGPTVWGSDGSQWKTISQRECWLETREKNLDWPAITMAGQSVFRWAVWGMAPVAQKALDAAGVRAEDLDAFIPHQANMRIIDAMIKQLKLPDGHPGRPRHRRDRPTPPPPPSPSPPSGCCARARRPAAASPCRSASAPGWSTPRRSSSCPDTDSRRPDG